MMKFVWIAAVAAIAGCAVPQKPVEMKNKFDPAAHAAYMQPGSVRVTGQAFLRQQGGGTVTCAGSRAVLFPATPYFRESVEILVRGGVPKVESNRPGPEFKSVFRETRCDAQGNFDLEPVAPGRYIVMSEVRWTIANSRQGGYLRREVDVVAGATNRFLLSDADR